MAEIKPLKLTALGGGAGKLEEFATGDTLPAGTLPANVAALAGLAGVADRLPYFTGAGALSLATLTAKARTLLASADEAAMRSFLELIKQTSVTDTAAGSVMLNGAHGIGATASVVSSNLHSNPLSVGNGLYVAVANDIGNPGSLGAAPGFVKHHRGSTSCSQVYETASGTPRRFQRLYSASSWSAWRETYDQGNILGTVSQASGIPTGALIERGSNVNGEYTKCADGTLECWHTITDSSLTIGTAFFGGFRSTGLSWTYPASFVSTPKTLSDTFIASAFSSLSTPGASAATYCYTAVTSQAAAERTIMLRAIGRWF